jgi:hypothetical protein
MLIISTTGRTFANDGRRRAGPKARAIQGSYKMMKIVREDDLLCANRKEIQEERSRFEETLGEREKKLRIHGFLGDVFLGEANYIYFRNKQDGLGYKAELTEPLYQAILQAIKKASPAKRERAKSATVRGIFGSRSFIWSSPSRIADAAALAEIDVRDIINELSRANCDGSGTGSNDDGIIYVLRHSSMAIVKIGRTKRLSTDRAAHYAVAHDDPGAWLLHHEAATKNVAAVEARIHARLSSRLAQYGYGSKEVFAISPSQALQAIYAEIEL